MAIIMDVHVAYMYMYNALFTIMTNSKFCL